jgi:hypothetical protein
VKKYTNRSVALSPFRRSTIPCKWQRARIGSSSISKEQFDGRDRKRAARFDIELNIHENPQLIFFGYDSAEIEPPNWKAIRDALDADGVTSVLAPTAVK